MNTFSDMCDMVMLDIEYRYSGGAIEAKGLRRKNVREMEDYVRSLVLEMQSADIPVKYVSGFATEDERNMVYINGRSVPEILEGLEIKTPDPDESNCECDGRPAVITIDSGNDWNGNHIEDIPDILMKNAIAKVYADLGRAESFKSDS